MRSSTENNHRLDPVLYARDPVGAYTKLDTADKQQDVI